MPQKVVATVGSPLWCINLSGVKTNGKSFTNLFFMNGGFGAAHDRDGANVLSWPSNISSTPVEMIEQLSPLRVKHRRFRTDTGGRGRFRGGTGQEILFENRSDAAITVAFLAERTRAETAPSGIAGGEAGAPGEVLINGERADPKVQHVIEAGGLIELKTPGGGGYGAPVQRDAAHAGNDIEDGYVSA
jgi:N-methylhydantoinase B